MMGIICTFPSPHCEGTSVPGAAKERGDLRPLLFLNGCCGSRWSDDNLRAKTSAHQRTFLRLGMVKAEVGDPGADDPVEVTSPLKLALRLPPLVLPPPFPES